MNVPPDPPEHRAGETRAGSRAAVWAVLVALLRCSADEPRTDAEERSERAAGGTVVELDPNEAPPAARCVAADCTLASLLPLDAASCCTSSGECGIDLGAGCVTPQFDADCSGDIGFGCCLESLCGTLDMATGACRPPPEVTEAERFRLDVAPELSAPPNRRLDCDGYLVATCGASSCSEGLLGPFACCLPDGSCGLSPDGATCYPGELLDVDDCARSMSLPGCCAPEGYCGVAVGGGCELTPNLIARPCTADAGCEGPRLAGCCLDGVACGQLDPIGGSCIPQDPTPDGYTFTCTGEARWRCAGRLCPPGENYCCTSEGSCAIRGTTPCAPLDP